MSRLLKEKFEYKTRLGFVGHCQIEVICEDNQISVIVSESPDNTGPSVENAIEDITEQFFKKHNLVEGSTRLLQRYSHFLDEITWDVHGGCFWKRLTIDEANKIFLIIEND